MKGSTQELSLQKHDKQRPCVGQVLKSDNLMPANAAEE